MVVFEGWFVKVRFDNRLSQYVNIASGEKKDKIICIYINCPYICISFHPISIPHQYGNMDN